MLEDLPIILSISMLLFIQTEAKAYEHKINTNVSELQATMSYNSIEGEAVTKALKTCEKKRMKR